MSAIRTITSALSMARLCALHALALDGVCGLSQAGGIGYPKRNASQAGEFLDRIPSGPRTGTHDGAIKAEQSVEEA